jgi:hypothetical protein
MASIRPNGNKWRVQLTIKGERRSATFDSEVAAKLWATETVNRICRIAKLPAFSDKMAAAQTLLVTSLPRRVLKAIASIPYMAEEILEACIPAVSFVGIYFLVKDREIVYVGQSGFDVLARISKHRREGRDFDAYAFMQCDKDKVDEFESMYITALMPKLNMSLGKMRLNSDMYASDL